MTIIVTKFINIILIVFLAAFVGLISTMFFIGSEETYQRLLKTPLSSFVGRALGGITLGLLGSGVLVLINYLVFKAFKLKPSISLQKVFWWTFLATGGASNSDADHILIFYNLFKVTKNGQITLLRTVKMFEDPQQDALCVD